MHPPAMHKLLSDNPEQYRESLSSMGKEQRHLLTDGALRWQMRAGKHVAPSYQLSDVAPEEFRNDWVDWWKRTNFEADETPFETLPRPLASVGPARLRRGRRDPSGPETNTYPLRRRLR